MPIRRRTTEPTVKFDARKFRYWDGTGLEPFFGAVGYATPAEAEAAWRSARRIGWGETYRFRLPLAAEVYDGLTRAGHELLWQSWSYTRFDARPVLEALDADVAAVKAFERADPEGAAAITDFLEKWRADLATMRHLAQACARHTDDSTARGAIDVPRVINSARKYDDGAADKPAA